MKEKIRVGIIVESLILPAWKNKLLQDLSELNFVEIVAVILPETKRKMSRKSFSLWEWHIRFDYLYFKPAPNAFEISDAKSLLNNIPITSLHDYENLKSHSLDLLLVLSESTIPDEIYELVQAGILYFAHGVNGKTSEAFIGYREFIKMKEVITSSLLLKVSAEKSANRVCQTWTTMPALSLSRSRNEHFWKLACFMPRALREIHRDGMLHCLTSVNNQQKLPSQVGEKDDAIPSNFTAMFNLGLHFNRMLHKTLRKLFFNEQWILLIDRKPELSTQFESFKKILPPKDKFWADPFLVENNGRKYLFFEELLFSNNKGYLVVKEVLADGFGPVLKVLEKPYHLSYPFVFEFENKWYLIPESGEAMNIQLYESTDFPTGWQHKMNLMEDICAMDSTLVFYENKWWLFATIAATKGASHHDELYLFYSDTPLTKEWITHPQNPIISDVRTARPAGKLFWNEGRLIRPSQDCSRKYGYGFNLNIIEEMTTTVYRERKWKQVRPDWDPDLKRTHSIAFQSGLTVIDGLIQRKK